jgi:Methylmalonic aciduria and homocystinuria type D protein
MSYSQPGSFQHGLPIHLIAENGQAIQMSVHRPSLFISQNLERVIPDWNLSVLWVVVVLQQARYELTESTPHVEREKERLREKFMRFGFDVAFNLRDRGFLSDLIDPRNGYPLLSRPGEIHHDDTAAVKALLGFEITANKCFVLHHPDWGTAVYPGILMASAPPRAIKSVLKSVAILHGWKPIKPAVQLAIAPLG